MRYFVIFLFFFSAGIILSEVTFEVVASGVAQITVFGLVLAASALGLNKILKWHGDQGE